MLARNGFFYPALAKQPQHKILLFSDGEDRIVSNLTGKVRQDGIDLARERSQAAWEALFDQVAARRPETLVISTEYASEVPEPHLAKVISRLRQVSDRVDLVGYFRGPASLSLSSLQQFVKFGSELRDPYEPFAYRKTFQMLQAVGADAVHVLPFRRDAFLDQCIFQDFLHRFLNLSEDQRTELPTLQSNETLSAEGMELIRSFNAWRGLDRRIPGEPVCKLVLESIQAADRILGLGGPRLHADVRFEIGARHGPDLAWLKEHAGIDIEEAGGGMSAPAPVFGGPDDDLRKYIAIDEDALRRLRAEVLGQLVARGADVGADLPGDMTGVSAELTADQIHAVLLDMSKAIIRARRRAAAAAI